jgi:hypothetical protein
MPHAAFMIAKFIDPGIVFPSFAFITIVYLVLAFLVAWRIAALDVKLIMLGLLTGVIATWCGLLVEEGISVQAGQVGLTVGTAAILGRLAVLLVLGGLASLVLTRWNSPAAPIGQGRDTHEN